MQLPGDTVKCLNAIRRMIPEYEYNRAPFMGLNIIFRMLGSPRAWQLGGEQVLRQLDPGTLNAVVDWARAILSGNTTDCEPLLPGQKYLHSFEPPVTHVGDGWPEMDLCNEELIERMFWMETMPIEFVESVARLAGN
ncbi:MAG: hypothetical protein P4L99_07130 [Chthoniobacter sp.]|nr:hypothetical protein [Chthoniobacter sp.]